jgi:hypothetical protein
VGRMKVESVEEAVEAAKHLQRPGRTVWFRGQAQDWPVRSTLVRVETDDRQKTLEKINRYSWWIKNTPSLENLATDTDAAIAVAQHYGMPTNFVDFTTDPAVAAFFASEKACSASTMAKLAEGCASPHPRDIIERDFRNASELENRKIVRKKVAQR